MQFSNTIFDALRFYALRLLGFPLFFDELPLVLRIVILTLTFAFITGVVLGSYRGWQKKRQPMVLFIYFAFVGLLPFLFLPDHIAPYYMSFSLLGVSAFFALSFEFFLTKYSKFVYIGLVLFCLLQVIGSQWTYKTHWLFSRARLAQKLISEKHLDHPVGSEEYFSLGAGSANSLFQK